MYPFDIGNIDIVLIEYLPEPFIFMAFLALGRTSPLNPFFPIICLYPFFTILFGASDQSPRNIFLMKNLTFFEVF